MEQNIEKNEPLYNLGLVLGGGGARGIAHLGVYKALLEAGIKPDIISGTSAGAIAGAMIASGHAPEECLTIFEGKRFLNFARPAMSKLGIMTMTGMEDRLKHFIKAETFEDLNIPLVVTAGDINAGLPVHFEKGPLIPAVLASASIPIVFVPRKINEVDYVDGGVFMNLPVRPIRERCKRIIAVSINQSMTQFRIGNILSMAERSFHLSIDANTRIDAKLSDWVIRPFHMSKYSTFDLDHVHEIFNEGYNTAVSFLAKNKIII
ncbi:MAG: patatin-like phospholipase family protein [Marinifilaceae bacterium]